MGKFVIKPNEKGFTFELKANNGGVVATSLVYASLASCKKGIVNVGKNAPDAVVEDQTVRDFTRERNPKFEMYTNRKGEFCFRLKAANGQVICEGEGYKAKKSCLNGIASVRKNADSPVEVEKSS